MFIPPAISILIVKIAFYDSYYSVFNSNIIKRPIVFVKVLDTVQAFYQSSSGTDGKTKGHWYPFYGVANNWIVKDKGGNNWIYNAYASPEHQAELKRVAELLNQYLTTENLEIPFVDFKDENEFNAFFGSHIPSNSSIYFIGDDTEYKEVLKKTALNGWQINDSIEDK